MLRRLAVFAPLSFGAITVAVWAHDPTKRYNRVMNARAAAAAAAATAAAAPAAPAAAPTASTAAAAVAPSSSSSSSGARAGVPAKAADSLSHGASKLVTLSDGRKLSFQQFGHPHGKAVFVAHSLGSSRFEIDGLGLDEDDTAYRLGVRLICVDRPGYGLSDPKADYTHADWPADVVALANALQIDTFSVLGLANGSEYALACAHALAPGAGAGAGAPQRLQSAAIVSAPAPFALTRQVLAHYSTADYPAAKPLRIAGTPGAPFMIDSWRIVSETMLRSQRMFCFHFPRAYLWSLRKSSEACPADVAALQRMQSAALDPVDASEAAAAAGARARGDEPAWPSRFLRALYEAQRTGVAGFYRDLQLYALPAAAAANAGAQRAHAPADISASLPVWVWHGADDPHVPLANARYHAHQLTLRGTSAGAGGSGDAQRNTHLIVRPNSGHFSLVADCWPDILRSLTQPQSQSLDARTTAPAAAASAGTAASK